MPTDSIRCRRTVFTSRLFLGWAARGAGLPVTALFLAALGGISLAESVSAQGFHGDKKYGEYYEEEKKWVEEDVSPPAYPRNENFIEFDAGAATRNRYFIDGTTLSVGRDGVVRYAIVIKAEGGASNVSYEGIRCESRERKLYAIGRSDTVWAPSRSQSWQAIRPGSYQAILSREYFCPNRAIILRAEEGVAALNRGGHPDAR